MSAVMSDSLSARAATSSTEPVVDHVVEDRTELHREAERDAVVEVGSTLPES